MFENTGSMGRWKFCAELLLTKLLSCGTFVFVELPDASVLVQIMDVFMTFLYPALFSTVHKLKKKKKILRLWEKCCTKFMEKGRSFCLAATTVRGCQMLCFLICIFSCTLFHHGSLYVTVSWIPCEISHNSFVGLFDWQK